CNIPRHYMWSPANLLQVLTYKVMTGRFHPSGDSDDRDCCCPDYRDFDAASFLKEFKIDECGRYHAARSFADACQSAQRSVAHTYDSFNLKAHSPYLLTRTPLAKSDEIAKALGVTIHSVAPAKLAVPSLEQAFRSAALFREGDSIYAYASEQA